MRGVYDGYVMAAPTSEALLFSDLVLLNIGSDVEDLMAALPDAAPPPSWVTRDHCSALVKLLPDYSELFFSQVTWSNLESMLRIFKLYDLPFTLTGSDADGMYERCALVDIACSLRPKHQSE